MKADAVEAMIAGRDLRDGAVDGARRNLARSQFDDRVADKRRVMSAGSQIDKDPRIWTDRLGVQSVVAIRIDE